MNDAQGLASSSRTSPWHGPGTGQKHSKSLPRSSSISARIFTALGSSPLIQSRNMRTTAGRSCSSSILKGLPHFDGRLMTIAFGGFASPSFAFAAIVSAFQSRSMIPRSVTRAKLRTLTVGAQSGQFHSISASMISPSGFSAGTTPRAAGTSRVIWPVDRRNAFE